MINKKLIAEMAHKIFRHQQGLHDPKMMHPEREWLVGLAITLLIFSISAYWSAHTYVENKNTTIVESANENNDVVVYRESLVKSALAEFSEREQQLVEMLGTPPLVVESAVTDIEESATSSENLGATVVGESDLALPTEATSSPAAETATTTN